MLPGLAIRGDAVVLVTAFFYSTDRVYDGIQTCERLNGRDGEICGYMLAWPQSGRKRGRAAAYT